MACVGKCRALMHLLGGKQIKIRTPLCSGRSRQSQTGEEAWKSSLQLLMDLGVGRASPFCLLCVALPPSSLPLFSLPPLSLSSLSLLSPSPLSPILSPSSLPSFNSLLPLPPFLWWLRSSKSTLVDANREVFINCECHTHLASY